MSQSVGDDLLPELARHLDYVQALADVAKALTANLKRQDVLSTIMKWVSQLLGPRNWSLMLMDPTRTSLVFEIAVGDAAEKLRSLRIPADEGIVGWVLEHRKPVVVQDVASDPRFSDRVDLMAHFSTTSVACAPLICRDEPLGVIELVNGPDDDPFTEEHLEILGPFADFAAIAIANARNFERLEALTLVDEWTKLYNARYLQTCVVDEVNRARRYGASVSLIFLDLDHFKEINDLNNHTIGSLLLREVGEFLLRSTRNTDRCIRYGGDEFVIVMPNTSAADADKLANRLQRALASYKFHAGGAELQTSASFGVATFPTTARTSDELLRQADVAMYKAKHKGRNCVVSADKPEGDEG